MVRCNLSELYSAFRDKYPNIKIGFSKFCTLRPKWCVLVGSWATHSVCVCNTHQNAVLLVDAIDWEYTYKDLIKKVVCDPDNKVCMMHRFESCLVSAALKKFLDDELSHLDMDSEFHYCQWQTTDPAALATLTMAFEEYKELFTNSINSLTRHLYLAKVQERYVKSKKESLGVNEVWCLGLRRELPVSDPGWDTKLPLEQRVLHIASPSHLLQRCWWKPPTHSLCFISDDNTHTTPVLFTRFRNWWNSWSRGSQTSQRSIMFLMVVVGNIKISRTSLIYVPIKRTFPSKQSGFSLQVATGNQCVMELVVGWNVMLQNKVCRDHSTTILHAVLEVCQEEMKSFIFLALTKKTWSRWERRWRRGLKMVRRYLVQKAVLTSCPSQLHKLDTNCS